ncbi:MAG TPA: hypothetical protein VJT71_04105 [Pyrinomonadaceae bacterium]|nr:hypothetical protein [Pyrinomonadaceae bacterium]
MHPKHIHMRVAVATIAILLSGVFSHAAGPPPGVEVLELAHKVLSGPDSDGDLKISIKVMLKNTTKSDAKVDITVQAIDSDNYEVFDVNLKGIIKTKQTGALTDTQYISEKLYKSIVKWQVEE